MKILIINGPNLNMLGKRDTAIYGSKAFDDFLVELKESYPSLVIDYFQSNHEGALIDKIHQCDHQYDGIILNAGGLTHTSVSLGDAIGSISAPVLEVHISNIYAREEFRRKSMLSSNCRGIIAGCGLTGYQLAIEYFIKEHQ